jgi:hypothetical protein
MDFLELLQHVSESETKPVAARGLFANVEQLDEGATTYSPQTGNLTITVIKPGWSKNNRYYSPALLKGATHIFEGAKMFVDHQTDKDAAARPEGSVKDWVGTITGVYAAPDGAIKASANIHNEAFKTNLSNLKKAGNLSQMGVSIRAFGEAKDGEAEGRKGKIIESLVGCKSVDFVTFAGAGGQVESMSEAFDPNDPDLVAVTETDRQPTAKEQGLIEYSMNKLKLDETGARAMFGFKPKPPEGLTKRQLAEYRGARAIGFSEADSLTMAKMPFNY